MLLGRFEEVLAESPARRWFCLTGIAGKKRHCLRSQAHAIVQLSGAATLSADRDMTS
jgi:hypothetical protein